MGVSFKAGTRKTQRSWSNSLSFLHEFFHGQAQPPFHSVQDLTVDKYKVLLPPVSYDIKTSEEGNEDAKREKTVFKETGLDSGDKESVIDGNFQITDLEGNVQGGNLLMGHNENAGKQRQPEGTYQQGIKQTYILFFWHFAPANCFFNRNADRIL